MTTTDYNGWERLALAIADDSDETRWRDSGLCQQTDPEIFFPETGVSNRQAKLVCSGCPVREQCLQHALDHREIHGVWGGLGERERRQLARNQKLAS